MAQIPPEMDESEDFAELLFEEVVKDGLDCSSVEMLCCMAKTGDWDTAASAVGYFAEMGRPDISANLVKRLMKPSDTSSQQLDYKNGAHILGAMIDSGNLDSAVDIAKYLLVARSDPQGHKALDCFDLCMVVGNMVDQDKAVWAGKLLFAFYSTEEDTEDGQAQATQTLVPFLLGTLIDHSHVPWAVEAGKQLMYSDLDEGDDPESGYDYSVLAWCMAQMVWSGRADWAACLCLELQKQNLDWYEGRAMLDAVAGWGDTSYSRTIENFMADLSSRTTRPA